MTESTFKEDYGVTILAEKGSGKTILLASEADKFNKFVFVDVLGVLNPESNYRSGIIPRSHYWHSVNDFIDNVIKDRNESGIDRHVINFAESEDEPGDIDKLAHFLITQGKNGHGYPLFVDEADDVLPEGKTGLNAIKIVKNGRNYGIKPFVCATQRPQGAAKKVIELAGRWLIGGETGYNTLKHVTAITGANEEVFKNMKPRHFYDTKTNKIMKVANYRYAVKQK